MTPFAGIVGQDTAISLLERAIAQGRVAPGYLFAGPAGVGRRRVALALATLLLGGEDRPAIQRRIGDRNHPDLLWVEPTYLHQGRPITPAEAEDLGVKRKSPPQVRLEQIRDVARFLSRPPLEAPQAVVVLEGAETMAEGAANGLLKTLEEPGNATLILLAPDTAALLPTLVSRCQTVPFRRLAPAELATVLTTQGQGDILQQPEMLALAQGSPGAAIAAWETLQALPSEVLAAVDPFPQTLRSALDLARLLAKDLDLETQLWLVDYLQQRHWHQSRSPQMIQALETARQHLRQFVQPRLVWEVTLMGMVA
ncbi:MAG: DNA polymerase III subunit delta' [Leptolyngbya sp.]|nr:DNA polymerase III subunit delta' [Leptolyngbya sp.]